MSKIHKYLFALLFVNLYPLVIHGQADSLKKILESSKNDSVRCIVLNELFEVSPSEEKKVYNDRLKAMAEFHLENQKQVETSYYKTQLALSVCNAGVMLAEQGNILPAVEKCNESLSMMKTLNTDWGIAYTMYRLSEIYFLQTDYVKSMELAQKSLELMLKINNEKGIANCYEDIGNCNEFAFKNDEKALEYYRKSLDLMEQIGYKKGIAYSLGNNARIMFKQNRLDEALEFNLRSLRLKGEIGDKKGMGYSYHKIGQIYLKKGKVREAHVYAQKSMDIANELKYPESIRRAAELLNTIYKLEGDYRKASEMYELFIVMRDSLNNIALQKATLQKEMQLEYEQKVYHDKLEQEKKEAVHAEQKKRQSILTAAISLVLILVMIFAVFIFRSLRQSNRQKKIIEEKQKDILDSIHYAKRIQRALMTSEKSIEGMIRRMRK